MRRLCPDSPDAIGPDDELAEKAVALGAMHWVRREGLGCVEPCYSLPFPLPVPMSPAPPFPALQAAGSARMGDVEDCAQRTIAWELVDARPPKREMYVVLSRRATR